MVQPILDDEDREAIDKALEMSVDAEENITRAEQAGIDVSGPRERLTDTAARLRKIRTAFFPGS